MSEHWQIEALAAASSRVSELIRSADLATPVEHLNRWKVRDVVAHLGGIHEWATRIVVARSMTGPGFKKSKLDGAELCDWFDSAADSLLTQLRTLGPADPCPNFNPGSAGTVEWWIRRQAHETTVHRWDIEAALGCTSPIAPKLAADGIDEFLDVFVRTRGKQTLDATLLLQTTRPKRQWTLSPAAKPGRIDISAGPPSEPAAAEVTGKPESLLLALWGRLSADEAKLTITGNPRTAAALRLTAPLGPAFAGDGD